MKRALADEDDAAFHRWRIRVKALYHLLQILAPVWPARICETLDSIRKLQKELGDDHDLTMVKATLNGAPGTFGSPCALQRVISSVDERSDKLRRSSRKLGEAIYHQKPRCFIEKIERHWRKRRQADGAAGR
jgi:CHAD domain-containing protein